MVYIKVFAAVFSWSLSFVLSHKIVATIEPNVAVFYRYAIGSVILLAVSWNTAIQLPKRWQDIVYIVALSLTGVVIYNYAFMTGLQHVTTVRAATIIPANPAVIAICAWLFFKETIGKIQWLGVVLSLFGAILAATNGRFDTSAITIYDGYLVLAIVSWTTFTFLGKSLLVKYSSQQLNCWAFIIALIIIASYEQQALWTTLPDITLSLWLMIAVLGVFSTAMSFIWYFDGIQKIGATQTAVFFSFIPILAILQAWLIFATPMTWFDIACAALVSIGVCLSQLKPTSK